MKTSITVKDKSEARAVQAAMSDAAVRAFVIVAGVLSELPSDRARQRVLLYVQDLANDPDSFPAPADAAGNGVLQDGSQPERMR
jgi:hypothetical protein